MLRIGPVVVALQSEKAGQKWKRLRMKGSGLKKNYKKEDRVNSPS